MKLPWRKKEVTNISGQGGWGWGWWPLIRESFTGAWQRNKEITDCDIRINHAVFSCMTLIAGDISKLRLRLLRLDSDGIWEEVENASFSPVLRKPNAFQTRIQFWESWILSKLSTGNTYVLKDRDRRGIVVRLYILDPWRVRPMVTDTGDVFYELKTDNLVGIQEESITVPAREIIHDRFNTLFHPLVGLSPIIAAALAAKQGINIQRDSSDFFANRALPGGILTAPGAIADETANRLKEHWETSFGGNNKGKIAVLGDGLKFEAMRATAEASQLVEQLRWTAEVICSVFHVPAYKIGAQPAPSLNNVQALNLDYYSQALQKLIEDAELVLDEGLGLPRGMETRFDLEGLLRMDTDTQMKSIESGIKAGVLSPDEGRKKLNLKPVPGGGTPYLQQQMWSLEQLARRSGPDDAPDSEIPEEPPDRTADALLYLNSKNIEDLVDDIRH